MAGRVPHWFTAILALFLITVATPTVTADEDSTPFGLDDATGDVDTDTLERCLDDRIAHANGDAPDPKCPKDPHPPACIAWDAWAPHADPDELGPILEQASDIISVQIDTEGDDTLLVSVYVNELPNHDELTLLTPPDPDEVPSIEDCLPENDAPPTLPLTDVSITLEAGHQDYQARAHIGYDHESGDVLVQAFILDDHIPDHPTELLPETPGVDAIPSNVDPDTDRILMAIPKAPLDIPDPTGTLEIPQVTSLVPGTNEPLDALPNTDPSLGVPEDPGLYYILGTLPHHIPEPDGLVNDVLPLVGVDVTPSTEHVSMYLGQTGYAVLHVTNEGQLEDDITLTLETPNGWEASISPATLTLEPEQTETVGLAVAPTGDQPTTKSLTVHANTEYGQEDTAEVTIAATTPPAPDPEPSPEPTTGNEGTPQDHEEAPQRQQETTDPDLGEETQDAPGPGTVLLVGLIALLSLARRVP